MVDRLALYSWHCDFLQIRFLFVDGENTAYIVQVPVSLNTNKFYHVIATYDSLSHIMKLYLDGKLLGVKHSVQKAMAVTSMPILIGAYLRSSTGALSAGFFDGIIDEVMIFNGVLSDHEISCLAKQWLQYLKLHSSACLIFVTEWCSCWYCVSLLQSVQLGNLDVSVCSRYWCMVCIENCVKLSLIVSSVQVDEHMYRLPKTKKWLL